MELVLIGIGTEVLLDGDIPAKVVAISIRGKENYVAYDCVWWDERQRRQDWIPADQVTIKGEMQIGNKTVRFK